MLPEAQAPKVLGRLESLLITNGSSVFIIRLPKGPCSVGTGQVLLKAVKAFA